MEGCKQRQQRLRARLVEEGVDAVVLTDHLVYCFRSSLLFIFQHFFYWKPKGIPGLLRIQMREMRW